MTLILLSDVRPERVTWLWPGRIPFGKLTILDGDGGLGKSTMLLDLAARLSRGAAFPDGPAHQPAGTVLLAVEDGLADTTQPRLAAAGADLGRIAALTAVLDEEGQESLPSIPEDLDAIERAIGQVNARLVLIDPIMSYLSGAVNSHGDHEVRWALTPLAALAERTGAAIVLVRHLNKTPGGKALYRGTGSIAFIGIVRSGLVVAEDPDDRFRRVLAASKANLAARPPSLVYRLVDGGEGIARVAWEGVSAHTADTLLLPQDEEERDEASDAERFLRDALAAGPRPARELLGEARAASIGERTLRGAKARLGVSSDKAHEAGGGWVWALPCPATADDGGKAAEGGQPPATPAPLPSLQPWQPSTVSPSSLNTVKDAKDVKAAKALERGGLAGLTGTLPCLVCGKERFMVEERPQVCHDCRPGYDAWRAARVSEPRGAD